MMKKLTVLLCMGVLAMAGPAIASVGPGTTIEEMNGTIGTWDRLDWVAGSMTNEADVDGDPYNWPDSATFASGGGGAQHLQINEAYERSAVHLEVDNVPTDAGVRLDSVMFQGAFSGGLEHWGMAVGIYFDTNNMIKLVRRRGGGGGLWMLAKINGAWSSSTGYGGYGFDNSWAMHGIELTATEV